jgi:hypothetical protein
MLRLRLTAKGLVPVDAQNRRRNLGESKSSKLTFANGGSKSKERSFVPAIVIRSTLGASCPERAVGRGWKPSDCYPKACGPGPLSWPKSCAFGDNSDFEQRTLVRTLRRVKTPGSRWPKREFLTSDRNRVEGSGLQRNGRDEGSCAVPAIPVRIRVR